MCNSFWEFEPLKEIWLKMPPSPIWLGLNITLYIQQYFYKIANTPYSLLETSATPSTTTQTTSSMTSAPAAMNKILYIDDDTGKTTLGNFTLINGLIRKLSLCKENCIYSCTMREFSSPPPQLKSSRLKLDLHIFFYSDFTEFHDHSAMPILSLQEFTNVECVSYISLSDNVNIIFISIP